MAIRNTGRERTGAIDPATGAIRFDDWDTVLGPSTTLKEFLASSLGQFAKPAPANELVFHIALAWCRLAGRDFSVKLAFQPNTRTIDYVSLGLRDEYPGKSAFEAERARDAAHKRWLRKHLPEATILPNGERHFAWGTVTVRYLPLYDTSRIVIGYDRPKNRTRRPRARRRAGATGRP